MAGKRRFAITVRATLHHRFEVGKFSLFGPFEDVEQIRIGAHSIRHEPVQFTPDWLCRWAGSCNRIAFRVAPLFDEINRDHARQSQSEDQNASHNLKLKAGEKSFRIDAPKPDPKGVL